MSSSFSIESLNDTSVDQLKTKKTTLGRRKIEIGYIEDKNKRSISFSKRKAGIMKKAFELSILTGVQVLLLVVSETGCVYSFSTPKLEPVIALPEGRRLIHTYLTEELQEESEAKPIENDVKKRHKIDECEPVNSTPFHNIFDIRPGNPQTEQEFTATIPGSNYVVTSLPTSSHDTPRSLRINVSHNSTTSPGIRDSRHHPSALLSSASL